VDPTAMLFSTLLASALRKSRQQPFSAREAKWKIKRLLMTRCAWFCVDSSDNGHKSGSETCTWQCKVTQRLLLRLRWIRFTL